MKKFKTFTIKRYNNVKFRLVDIIFIGYFGLVGILLIFFHKEVPNYFVYILIHAVVILTILEIVRAGENKPQNKFLWFARAFYPIAIVLYGWSEIGALSRMFFGNFWATEMIIRLDYFIFDVYPPIWFQQFYRPWLDEFMHFFYDTYFLFMPIVGLTLFIQKKYKETFAAFALGSAVHLSNFVLFFIFPVLAPFMTERISSLSTNHYSGYLFYYITKITQAHGAQIGGTFPSSHVSATLAWAFAALRYNRKLGYVLLPWSLVVGFATVYLGHHYAMDPIFGYIWCIIIYPIVLKILKVRNEEPLQLAANTM